MNAFYIVLIVLAAIVLVFLLIGGGARSEAKKPIDSGEQGENMIALILSDYAQPDDKLINDVILCDPDTGMSSQIDHIFICSAGIYVIETKNYSGDVYGDDGQREWTQNLVGGRTQNKIPSPVKQNATHIYLVNKLTGNQYHTDGAVVFVQGNTQHINSSSVKTISQLRTMLENLQRCRLLSPNEIQDAYQKLIQNRDSYQITPEDHIRNIRKMQTDIAHNICPRCGGKLVLRNGKNGQFYGCSNFPKCKFTKDV